jgi:hypothetical protein
VVLHLLEYVGIVKTGRARRPRELFRSLALSRAPELFKASIPEALLSAFL